MRHIFIFITALLLLSVNTNAQQRLIDASDHRPISAASILDASGNMVGFTMSDGVFSEIPKTAYPITITCIGYEQIVIEHPEEKNWEMTPMVYELEEVVIIPEERKIMKQTFYVREYFSISSQSDTMTFFMEHMADRFVPVSDKIKFSGSSSLRILCTNCYMLYQIADNDSVAKDHKPQFPSMLSILGQGNEKVTAHESLLNNEDDTKIYEKPGHSGTSIIQKQNAQTFTTIKGLLAGNEEQTSSPWYLKPLGLSMDISQLYITNVYRANENGIYLPKDLIESSFVMEAEGKGRLIRKMVNSNEPVGIHSMITIYMVDRDYLTKEKAKEEQKNKPADVKFTIPSTVPPLNDATKRLVERANSEAR